MPSESNPDFCARRSGTKLRIIRQIRRIITDLVVLSDNSIHTGWMLLLCILEYEIPQPNCHINRGITFRNVHLLPASGCQLQIQLNYLRFGGEFTIGGVLSANIPTYEMEEIERYEHEPDLPAHQKVPPRDCERAYFVGLESL
jgi:hypothetical protein